MSSPAGGIRIPLSSCRKTVAFSCGDGDRCGIMGIVTASASLGVGARLEVCATARGKLRPLVTDGGAADLLLLDVVGVLGLP
jgi:hypothetical protein